MAPLKDPLPDDLDAYVTEFRAQFCGGNRHSADIFIGFWECFNDWDYNAFNQLDKELRFPLRNDLRICGVYGRKGRNIQVAQALAEVVQVSENVWREDDSIPPQI